MLNTKRIVIFQLIRNYVQRKGPCSRIQILNHLAEHDFDLASRTFDRIRLEMQDLGWELSYQNGEGYRLIEEDPEDSGNLFLLLNTVGHLTQHLKDLKALSHFVHLSKNSFRGQHLIQELLKCSMDQNSVRFEYTKYQDHVPVKVLLDPYQLRENNGRWYIVGAKHLEDGKALRVYGLDRMYALENTRKKFKRLSHLNPDEYFSVRMGIGIEDSDTPVEIILEADAEQWNWIESHPWHSTQKLIEKKENLVLFSLFVVPNMELRREILTWSPHVRILSPLYLKKQHLEKWIKPLVKSYQ